LKFLAERVLCRGLQLNLDTAIELSRLHIG
jgi:hypothetical protein